MTAWSRLRGDRYALRLELPGLPKLNTAKRRHWRVDQQEVAAWRDAVAYLVKGKLPPAALSVARVAAVRRSCAHRCPDYDNLAQSFKPLVDGLVVGGVLEDDAPRNLSGGRVFCGFKRVGRPRSSVVLVVVASVATPTPR